MKLLESLIKRKTITIFFILAYTFAILTFSIGKSAITSQIIKNKNYNKLNNQLISFENCNIDITSEELLNILKDEDISIILFNYQYMHDNTIELTTELKSDGFFYAPDIKTGEYFSKDDFHSTEPIAIFSPTIKLNNNTFKLNSDIELHCKGIVYDRTAKIVIPNKIFFDNLQSNIISTGNIGVIINGNEKDINSTIDKLNKYIASIDSNSNILTSPYVIQDVNYESNILYKASFLIIFITVINSISISSLWIEERKKEIVLRKVFGAKNSDIFKLFFLELIVISLISMLLSLFIQWLISFITGGYIYNIDLTLHLNNFIYSFVLAILTAYCSALPAFKHLTKIQPANLLKED